MTSFLKRLKKCLHFFLLSPLTSHPLKLSCHFSYCEQHILARATDQSFSYYLQDKPEKSKINSIDLLLSMAYIFCTLTAKNLSFSRSPVLHRGKTLSCVRFSKSCHFLLCEIFEALTVVFSHPLSVLVFSFIHLVFAL